MPCSVVIHAKLEQQKLFESLKAEIMSLATAIYGTKSSPTTATDVFDVCTYTYKCTGETHDGTRVEVERHNAVLVVYSSPGSGQTWRVLAKAEDQGDMITATEALRGTLREGMGSLMHYLADRNITEFSHKNVPDSNLAGALGL